MGLSKTEQLTIALSFIICLFLLICFFVIFYFMRRYSNRSASLTIPLEPNRRNSFADHSRRNSFVDHPRERDREEQFYEFAENDMDTVGRTDLETHASNIVSSGVSLLRSCKKLSHNLLAQLIDGATAEGSDLVFGSLDIILEAIEPLSSKADELTRCIYPPIYEVDLVQAATSLVSTMDNIVRVTKENCEHSKLAWVDEVAIQIIRDFKRLCVNVDQFREVRSDYLRNRAENHPNVHV
eukprot:m.8340 g.8340  ORF g.8340 m.8340 type:complete len:239 (-) comp3094_c0_seq1:690-1406(-)